MDFSIIIPCGLTYDFDFAQKCLESALNQDYNGSYEIIIIKSMLEDEEKDPFLEEKKNQNPEKIKIHYFKTTRGVSTAGFNRQKGVEVSRGEYLAFLDIDDFLSTKALGLIKEYSKEVKYDAITPVRVFDFKRNRLIEKNFWNSLHGDFFKRTLIVENAIIFPKTNKGQDSLLRIQLIFTAKNKLLIEECIYFYVYNKASVTWRIETILHMNIQEFFDVIDTFTKSRIFENSVNAFYDERYPPPKWPLQPPVISKDKKKQTIINYFDSLLVESFIYNLFNNLKWSVFLSIYRQLKKTRLKKRYNKRCLLEMKRQLRQKAKPRIKKILFKDFRKTLKILLRTGTQKPFYMVLDSEKIKGIEIKKNQKEIYLWMNYGMVSSYILKRIKGIYIKGFRLDLIEGLFKAVKKDVPIHLCLTENSLKYLKNVQEALEYYPLERITSIVLQTRETTEVAEVNETTEVVEIREAREVDYKQLLQKIFFNAKIEII